MLRRLSALASLALLAIGVGLPVSAAETRPGAELSIRFYDKRIYYPGGEVALKISLTNTGSSTLRFKLAEDRVYSLSFDVRTPANRALDAADSYKAALVDAKAVFYREISVEPGEEYSFVERLDRFVRLDSPGTFSIRAGFWPELAPRSGDNPGLAPLLSNTLLITLRPSPGLPPAAAALQAETGDYLKPQPLPPDEVVRRTIVARQRSRWNEFFLYLDLESLLLRDEAKKRAYDRESDEGRRAMLERYKADLQESVVDGDIVTIPADFRITETRYAETRGTVRVLEKFDYRTFRLVKEYSYELARRDDIWRIVGYTVLNKGTE